MDGVDWPPSNYPIFLALVLLVATAVTLAMGDEGRAEELAIYAYYFLVIGVSIRFFELVLPEDAAYRFVQRVISLKMACSAWFRRLARFRGLIIWPGSWTWIGGAVSYVSRGRGLLGRFLVFSRLRAVFVYVSDISRNVAVFLSVFFFISLIYGYFIDWWVVRSYMSNLVLVILGFLTLHFFSRRKVGS